MAMLNRVVATIITTSILCGCATSPKMQAKQAEFFRTIPTCSGAEDCNAKWEAAQLWVVHNAGWKIQTQSSVVIETYNAVGSSPRIAVRVTKEPLGGGKYQFLIDVRCDNIFGCQPNSWDAALDFNRRIAAVTLNSPTVPDDVNKSSKSDPQSVTVSPADPMRFQWPVNGAVLTQFNEKSRGLDIDGKLGDPVVAARGGVVVFSRSGLNGFGNLIIIKHDDTYLTAYAHNNELLVKEGARVEKGQVIAKMGSTDSDRVKLHFEIRKHGTSVDPIPYLPSDKPN
jgi:hypothetical protein